MKVILANKAELTPIVINGAKRNVYGVIRDSLTFVFPASDGMDAIDSLFTAENCERIIIEEDGGNLYLHNAYNIRVSLIKESVEVEAATENSDAVYEDRIMVTMAQRTYVESHLAAMQAAIDMLCMEDVEV